jgi:hypothetical protein
VADVVFGRGGRGGGRLSVAAEEYWRHGRDDGGADRAARLRAERDAEREKLELAAAMGEQVVVSNLNLERTSEAAATAAAEAQAQVAAAAMALDPDNLPMPEEVDVDAVELDDADMQDLVLLAELSALALQAELGDEREKEGEGGGGERQLPEGWQTAVSRSTGEVYYENPATGEATYDFPSAAAGSGPAELADTQLTDHYRTSEMAAQLELAKQEAARLKSQLAVSASEEAKEVEAQRAEVAEQERQQQQQKQVAEAAAGRRKGGGSSAAASAACFCCCRASARAGDSWAVEEGTPPSGKGRVLGKQRTQKAVLFHGTSLDNALRIQDEGFNAKLSGATYRLKPELPANVFQTNLFPHSDSLLGHGIYATQEERIAWEYATGGDLGYYTAIQPHPMGGCVLRLEVDVGRVYYVESATDKNRVGWAEKGYDSAYLKEEDELHGSDDTGGNAYHFMLGNAVGVGWHHSRQFCIADPRRIRVVGVLLTDEAQAAGWCEVAGRLVRPKQYTSVDSSDADVSDEVPTHNFLERRFPGFNGRAEEKYFSRGGGGPLFSRARLPPNGAHNSEAAAAAAAAATAPTVAREKEADYSLEAEPEGSKSKVDVFDDNINLARVIALLRAPTTLAVCCRNTLVVFALVV